MNRVRVASLAWAVLVAAPSCDKSSAPTAAPDDAPVAAAGDPADPAAPTPAADAEDPVWEPEGEATEPEAAAVDPVVEVPADPAAQITKPKSMALVKIEIKAANGKVLRDAGKVIDWRQPTRIKFDFQEHAHEFIVELTPEGKPAKKVAVKIGYEVDASEVLRSYRYEAKTKKREVIRIDDGSALAVTISSKTIKPKPSDRTGIKATKGKDPLSGAK